MDRKYIFLDIDGTLVNFKGDMREDTLAALKKAHENGHKLIISTGRQQSQIYPWLLALGIFDGVIATAGANIRVEGKTLSTHFFPKDKLCILHEYLEKNKMAYAVQTEHAMKLEKWCYDMILGYHEANGMSSKAVESLFGGLTIVDDAREIPDAEKIAYYNAPKGTVKVNEDIGDYFYVNRYSFGDSPDLNGEISVRGCNKASGMQEILDYFGAKRESTIAFGDADNDIEMLTFANTGVAMGNASPLLKENADIITDDIDNGGISKAFTLLKLI